MFFSFCRDRKKLKMGIGIFKARNKIKRKVNIWNRKLKEIQHLNVEVQDHLAKYFINIIIQIKLTSYKKNYT